MIRQRCSREVESNKHRRDNHRDNQLHWKRPDDVFVPQLRVAKNRLNLIAARALNVGEVVTRLCLSGIALKLGRELKILKNISLLLPDGDNQPFTVRLLSRIFEEERMVSERIQPLLSPTFSQDHRSHFLDMS